MYVVVFKLTDPNFLVRVEYWLRQIKVTTTTTTQKATAISLFFIQMAVGPDSTVPILLVGTHVDASTPEAAERVMNTIARHIGPQVRYAHRLNFHLLRS